MNLKNVIRTSSIACAVASAAIFAGCNNDDNGFFFPFNNNNSSNADTLDREVVLFVSNVADTIKTLKTYSPGDRNPLPAQVVVNTKLPNPNGVVVDTASDYLYQLSRRDGKIRIFANARGLALDEKPIAEFSDNALMGGQEIAYDATHDILYVAANSARQILAYVNPVGKDDDVEQDADRTYDLTGEPWGIHYDGMNGNDRLIVAIDKSTKVEVYDDVSTLVTGAVVPSTSFNIDGAVRLHGISFSTEDDVLVVSDIATVMGLPADDDGSLFIFDNADSLLTMGSGVVTADRMITGSNTQLGNPVDVAIDHQKNNIYVAEKAQRKILRFNIENDSNVHPTLTDDLDGIPEAVFVGYYK